MLLRVARLLTLTVYRPFDSLNTPNNLFLPGIPTKDRISTLTPISVSQIHTAQKEGDGFSLYNNTQLGQVRIPLWPDSLARFTAFTPPTGAIFCPVFELSTTSRFALGFFLGQVSLVGIIRAVEKKSTKISYTIEDHTGEQRRPEGRTCWSPPSFSDKQHGNISEPRNAPPPLSIPFA